MGSKAALPKTYELLESARDHVFPSYALNVLYGNQNYELYGNCSAETLFDLASLTKVLCTTTLYALAEQKWVLTLDRAVQEFFPKLKDPRVRLSHLLNHSSGLPAWLPLHAHFHNENDPGDFDPRKTPPLARKYYEEEILKSFNASAFEKNIVYSDLGFMLLGWILNLCTQSALDSLFQEWIAQPLGLETLQFLPTYPDIAPTEDCPWRKRVLKGEVHDDNCYVLGGVAGHAGLFGNAREVLAIAREWLNASHSKASLLQPETVEKYWTTTLVPHTAKAARVLGWDCMSNASGTEISSTGRFFSSQTRGHLGFTGTSLWIDPERELIVTLLTNRVHPRRDNEKIKTFRPILHDTLLAELGIGN